MKSNQILHVMILDKFLAPFIDFVDEHFGRDNHHYVFITSEKYDYGLTPEHNVEFLYTDDDIFITLLEYMNISKKIILHGLWRDKVDVLLYFNQELLQKSYWIMWGGDFYFPETKSKIRHNVIENMGYLVNVLAGDYKLVQEWYGVKGQHIECFGYPSNIYNTFTLAPRKDSTTYIQIGNSATETNNHFDIFEKLLKYKNENIKIFAPLSYGNVQYGHEVAEKGKSMFGDKFIPIFEFMPFEDYLQFLGKIDISIFAHKRCQAMGNTVTLLGLGKKVYLNSESTIFQFFKEKDIQIFDIDNLELSDINIDIKKDNINKVKSFFSKEVLIKILKEKIFH